MGILRVNWYYVPLYPFAALGELMAVIGIKYDKIRGRGYTAKVAPLHQEV